MLTANFTCIKIRNTFTISAHEHIPRGCFNKLMAPQQTPTNPLQQKAVSDPECLAY